METYFTKFPNITYNNSNCIDITRNVSIRNISKRINDTFYLYTNDNSFRSDQISEYYYDDPHIDWLIFLANHKIDPYYDWFLNIEQFESFIIQKYRSIELAVNKIKHWELSYDNTEELLPSTYNALPQTIKKYYVGKDFVKGNPTIYKANESNWSINTNKITQFEVTFTDEKRFIDEELIQIKQNPSYDTVLGRAEFISANDTSIICKDVRDSEDDGYYLVGRTSGASAQIISSTTLKQVIPLSEVVYWRPVSFYEWEQYQNEQNKIIELIDKNSILEVSESFRKLLKE